MFRNLIVIIGLIALALLITSTLASTTQVATSNEPVPDYVIELGPDLYLPSLAEQSSCDAEIALGFGFAENRVEIMKTAMFYGEVQGRLSESCYLFRDVHGAAANKMVADVMKMFVDQDYWHGIPSDFGGIYLVQSKENANHIAFSFLNEDAWLGPYAGVAGFDLSHEEGLRMYLWSYNGFY